jgi:RHS repeat-associated protein
VDKSASRYGYTGKERDEESGLCYHGARYYACWLARWITCDPAGLIDGANTYWYARCNPAGFIDSSGKQSRRTQTMPTVAGASDDQTPAVCNKPLNECIHQLPESHAFRQRVYEKRGAALGASEPTFPETFADEFPSGFDRPAGLKWSTTFTTSQLAREQLDFGAGLIVNLTMGAAASTGNVRLDMLRFTLGMEIGGIAQTARHGNDPANWDSGELASDALFAYSLVPGRPSAPEMSGPTPLLSVKRSPRSIVQGSTGERLDAAKVMGGRARTISGRSEDVWMHNKGHGLGGAETRENLFAGSWGANTIQKHFEDVVSPGWLKARGIAEPGVFETEVLTFVRTGTDVGECTLERIWLDDELILDGFLKSTEPPLRGADVDFWRIPAKTKK